VVNLTLIFESKLQVRVQEESGQQTEFLVNQSDSSTFVMNRVPKKCSVNLQGHTQAATYKLVFDYRELPIDPRTVVACSAEIHLGTVSASDFAEGMRRTLPNGNRRSILVTRTDDNVPIDDNLLMVGPADNWTVEFGADGAEVHIEGRDLRGLLLDSPLVSFADVYDEANPTRQGMPSRRRRRSTILSRIQLNVPIQTVIKQILAEHDTIRHLPTREQIQVRVYPEEWPDQKVLGPGDEAVLPRNRRGANGQGANAGGASNSMNFWDLITRMCYLVGAVPKFVGRNLEIRYAPSLFNMIARDRSGQPMETPFRPNRRRELGEDAWGIRRLVWGRDIQSMKIARKYAGVNKPHSIRVVAQNTGSGARGRRQMLQVVWPPRTVREARAQGVGWTPIRDALGGQESQEIRTYRVPGVASLARLTQIAQSFYEQIGRQEMSGDIEASRVTSFGGTNADPDLLRLRVGDPIELLVDASRLDSNAPIVSTLNATAQLPYAESVAQVARHLNGNTGLARVIVATARGNIMGALRYFMVSSVNFDWSYEEVTVKADVQNYIIYRWGETDREGLANARRHSGTRVANRTGTANSSTTSATPQPANAERISSSGAEEVQARRDGAAGETDIRSQMERAMSRWRQ
jgi:hypothetical protein